ncbi:endonuclease III [Candidatus Bipolaricaulota bacterium]|nr:endonuclease III [Candidatus Bipolaricaulota bacterium]
MAKHLRDHFGPVGAGRAEPPLDLLVRTILSQHTADRNRDQAYATLRDRFPTWEEVLAAPESELARAIQGAGLQRQRAKRLKEVLERLYRERGTLSLDFLSELPDGEAARWLLSLPGVGKKTAYIVLLFGFGRPFFPVDTHVARVSRRLGLASDQGDPHALLAPLVPHGKERELHLHLIRLGREICRPQKPRCAACPLLDLCPHGRKETR